MVDTTSPGECEVAFGTTERADVESLGPMGAGSGGADVEVDADFFVVGCVDAAVDDFGPKAFPIGEFLSGGRVMEKSVSTFSTEDAGNRSREPAPTSLKGLALTIITSGFAIR